jgi:hypothetical protein
MRLAIVIVIVAALAGCGGGRPAPAPDPLQPVADCRTDCMTRCLSPSGMNDYGPCSASCQHLPYGPCDERGLTSLFAPDAAAAP